MSTSSPWQFWGQRVEFLIVFEATDPGLPKTLALFGHGHGSVSPRDPQKFAAAGKRERHHRPLVLKHSGITMGCSQHHINGLMKNVTLG